MCHHHKFVTQATQDDNSTQMAIDTVPRHAAAAEPVEFTAKIDGKLILSQEDEPRQTVHKGAMAVALSTELAAMVRLHPNFPNPLLQKGVYPVGGLTGNFEYEINYEAGCLFAAEFPAVLL